jgi:hypothetical protein
MINDEKKTFLKLVEGKVNISEYCPDCVVKKTDTSKHCLICDTCIEGFDHHCYWVNNCIGKRNLHLFIAFIVFTIGNIFYNMAISILGNILK